MAEISLWKYQSPLGDMVVGSRQERLCLCHWLGSHGYERVKNRLSRMLSADFVYEESEVNRDAISQLKEYFLGNRVEFDLPLEMKGTEFQQRVWRELQSVEYGVMVSYSEIASCIGNPTSTRAVAQAVGANPIAIILPCHRIVGVDGSIRGFAGGIERKQFLLEFEKKVHFE